MESTSGSTTWIGWSGFQPWKGTSLWSSADAEAQLHILLQGVDLMFDRATATLARTSYTSRCWLNTYSKDVFWPHAFRLVSCFKRYVSVWKRFICFIFRVLRFKARQRQQIYNLRLGSDEEKMMQYILTLVAQLLLEGGGCDLDRLGQEDLAPIDDCNQEYREADDDDDSETDEDADYEEEEHVEEENYPMGDESDFVPPSGSWLQLSEALFQLSMMFWTHRDPAGNMASSALIYYTAVMGIQRESLAYHSANNSTPGLAALIWVGRVLFLEYALPVYRYGTLAYHWPSRDQYPSQPDRLDAIRKRYLIRGCYTPFGEIIELKAFAKSIIRQEGIPGNLSWAPDGLSFKIGHDKEVRLSDFCGTYHRVITLVHEQVKEMMLGIELKIDINDIRDDLTCRIAGWSFLQKAENKLADLWKTLANRLQTSYFRGKPFTNASSWHPETCVAYLNAGIDLNKSAFAALQLAGGLPGRGTEVTSIRYLNTKLAIRNVFFYGGQMIVVISYNKARASNNYAFYIVRYLPPDLSLSLLKYLAIVRPAMNFLANQLKLSHYASNEFFFQDPCGKKRHLSSVQASCILKNLTRDLVTPWTLSLYRQAALAIAKRYLSKLVEKTNHYYPSDATNPIRMFAAGAGHHPRMLLTAYAIDKALPARLQPELLEMYYRLSTMWQEWNQQYYHEHCRASKPKPCVPLTTGSKGRKRAASPNDPKRGLKRVMTSVNNNDMNGLLDGFIHNAQYQILICAACGSMVQPETKSFYSHLNSIHRITGTACEALMDRFSAYELCPFSELAVPKEKVPRIAGLPIHRGFRCNICPQTPESSYFTVSSKKIREHMSVHKLGIMPMRAEQQKKFQPCYIQTFSSAKGRIRYFEVEPI